MNFQSIEGDKGYRKGRGYNASRGGGRRPNYNQKNNNYKDRPPRNKRKYYQNNNNKYNEYNDNNDNNAKFGGRRDIFKQRGGTYLFLLKNISVCSNYMLCLLTCLIYLSIYSNIQIYIGYQQRQRQVKVLPDRWQKKTTSDTNYDGGSESKHYEQVFNRERRRTVKFFLYYVCYDISYIYISLIDFRDLKVMYQVF